MAVPPAPYFTPISPHELAHDDDDASRYSAASGSVTRAGQGMSVLYGGPEHGNQIGLGAQLRALLPRVSFVPGAGRVPGGGSAAAAVQPALSAQGAVKLTRAGVAPSEPTSAPAGMPGQLLPVLADSPGPSPTPCSSRTVSLLHGDAYSPAAASSSLMGDETDDGGERDTYKDPGGGEDPNAPAAEAEPQEQLAFAGAPRRGETLRLHDSQFDERYVRLAVRGADSVQVRAQAQAQAQAQAPTEIVSVGELPPAPPYRSYASTPPPCEDRTTATAMHISIPREIPSVSLSPQWRSRGWRQTLRQRARFRDSSPGAAGADLEAERTPPFAHYSPGGSLQPPTQSFLAFQNRKRAAARGEAYRQSRMSRGDRHQSQHQRKGAAAAGHGPYIHNWGMPTHWPQETTAPHRQHPYRYDPVNGSPRPDQRFASAYAGPGDGHGYARYSVNFNHPGQRPQGDDGRLPPSAFSPMTPSCRHTSGLPPGGRPRPPSSCDSDATPYGDGSGEGSLHSKSTARVSHAPNFEDLFFDLLFVANLAVYAEAQQLNSLGKVGGFLAYFCLLWWTWYSHSLFDVRFRTRPGIIKTYLVYYPQLLNRLVQVGIWVAFTTTGGQFVRLDFTSFSQIYALNRLSLALDYLIIVVDKARGVWRGSDVDGFAAPSVRLAVGAGVGAGFNGQPLPLGQAGDLERNSELYPETKRGDRMFKAHRPLVLAMMGKVPQADLARTGGLPAAVQNVTEKRRMERRLVLQRCLGPAIGLASTLVSVSALERRDPKYSHSLNSHFSVCPLPCPRQAFIWYMSSHISAGLMDANVRRSRSAQNSMGRFAVWFGATLTEIVLLFFAEWKTDMISLRHTQICERLALFAIVIVGEGFSVIGSTLNTLSPGLEKKATSGDRHFVPSDGWDMDVVMQAGATVLVLCFSFVTYYRDAMLELRHSSSLTILGWSFLHVVYFAAAALMVVGLRRLICFHSTISAFTVSGNNARLGRFVDC